MPLRWLICSMLTAFLHGLLLSVHPLFENEMIRRLLWGSACVKIHVLHKFLLTYKGFHDNRIFKLISVTKLVSAESFILFSFAKY